MLVWSRDVSVWVLQAAQGASLAVAMWEHTNDVYIYFPNEGVHQVLLNYIY